MIINHMVFQAMIIKVSSMFCELLQGVACQKSLDIITSGVGVWVCQQSEVFIRKVKLS